MNRQKMVLFILLIILVLAAASAYLRMPRQKRIEKPKFTTSASPAPTTVRQARQDDRKLHLELLDRQATAFKGFKRNIFRLPPLQSTAKTMPPPPPPPPLPPPPPQQTISQPPPTAEAIAQAEMAKFTFLGFLQKDSRKTIFLSKDNEIFVVSKGDKLANRFQVISITDDAMTIQSLPDGAQTIISLQENMPLLSQRRR